MPVLSNVSNASTLIVTNTSRYMDSVDIIDLNHQIALLHIPGTIFLGILATIGIIGNSLVLYIYSWKIRPSNHRIFIIFLATVDLTVSAISMPNMIYEQIYPLMQHRKWRCKITSFISYLMINASLLILLVIAGDRYQKICKPLKRQMSLTQAKVSCVVVMTISVFTTLPVFQIFGLNTVETKIPGLTGVRCYIDDVYINTSHFVAVSVISIALVYITLVVLSVLYSFVILKIRQNSKKVNIPGGESSNISVGSSTMSNDDHHLNGRQETDVYTTDIPQSNSNNGKRIEKRKMETHTKNIHGNIGNTKLSTSRRITVMLLTITVVFFLSYTPQNLIQLILAVREDFEQNLGPFEYCILNVLQLSYFINNMANPVIYGFCDKRFMKEMKVCCGCAHAQPE